MIVFNSIKEYAIKKEIDWRTADKRLKDWKLQQILKRNRSWKNKLIWYIEVLYKNNDILVIKK